MSRIRSPKHYESQEFARRKGVTFFEGDTCKKCSNTEYYSSSGKCSHCLKAIRKKTYEKSLRAKLAKANVEKANDQDLSGWIAKHKQNPMYQVWGGV